MSTDPRPAIAIVSNSQTPYRLHLHRRIAAEIPQIKLWSVYTHEISNSDWGFEAPPEIGPISFGPGERSDDQSKPTRALHEWRKAGRIIRWMVEQNIRFVVMMGYNDAGRLRLIRWCRKRSIPCFVFGDSNIRGDFARGLKAVIKKIIVGTIIRNLSGVFACGSLGREYFKKYGAADEDIFYFPYEPDYTLMQHPRPESIALVKEKLSLNPARHRIVYSGRLAPVKRVDLLIEAFLAIALDRRDWDLLIVGDGPLMTPLKMKVPPLFRSRVTWAGFVSDPATLSAIYHCCDVLVLPSDYEPWALVINEAVAAGLVVVCTDVVGAAAELVRDGVNGRVFPPGDEPKLAEALADVTTAHRLSAMQAAAPAVLADWRERGDPVAGLRAAMKHVGVLNDLVPSTGTPGEG